MEKLIRNKKDMENLKLGDFVRLNIEDRTISAAYMSTAIKGNGFYKFSVLNIGRIKFVEIHENNLVTYGGEICLPPEFLDPNYGRWTGIRHQSSYSPYMDKRLSGRGI